MINFEIETEQQETEVCDCDTDVVTDAELEMVVGGMKPNYDAW